MGRHSIRTQFMAIVVVLSLSFAALSLAAYQGMCDLLTKKNHGYAMNSSLSYAYSMNDLFLRVTNISGLLALNDDVLSFLNNPLDENTISLVRRLSNTFFTFVATNSDIPDISIVGHHSYRSVIYSTAMLDQLWAQMGSRRGVQCLGMVDTRLLTQNESPLPYLVFGCNVFSSGSQEPLGCLFLSVNLSHFTADSALFPEQTSQTAHHFLGTSKTSLYPFRDDDSTARAVEADISANSELFNVSGSSPVNMSTERYDYVCLLMPDSDFYIVSAIDKWETASDLDGTRLYVLLAIVLFTLFLLSAFLLLLRGVVLPLRDFHARIHSIRSGNRKAMQEPLKLTGCSEISELSSEFNGMLSQILSLEAQLVKTVETLYAADIERQKAEIAHLRSQINPHFLYNTLESIKGLAIRHGVPEIADIATAIGKISRYSIKGAVTVTLSEEMEIADAYLRIQKTRFGNRFDAIMNIPESCRMLMVPKMLLQPLAENAVIHGLENKEEGTLYIGAHTEENVLLVVVQDDGEGMDAERLEEIRNSLDSEAPEGGQIGLRNIHRRIRLSCGSAYGLTIDSAPGSGTKVTVRLPIKRAEEPQKEETSCTEC
jgi:two-component system, sensor histidine kinase YesM